MHHGSLSYNTVVFFSISFGLVSLGPLNYALSSEHFFILGITKSPGFSSTFSALVLYTATSQEFVLPSLVNKH